jgi:alkanesulfonate monooxygenase
MHPVDHVSKYFKVRGPLTLPRSPQGRPVIAQAGASADGVDFAAAVADIVYALQTRFEDAQVFYKASKERAAKLGRNPDDVKILPGLLPIVARTNEEAQAKYKRLLSYLDPLVGLERLTRFFGDLSGHDLDGPLPDLRPDVRLVSRAELNLRLAREHNWTIRQLYESTVISHGHHVAVGSPTDVADVMERWIKEEAADGFNIVPAVLPSGIDEFVELVILRVAAPQAVSNRIPRIDVARPSRASIHSAALSGESREIACGDEAGHWEWPAEEPLSPAV